MQAGAVKSRERDLVLFRNKQNSAAEDRIESVFSTPWVTFQVRALVKIGMRVAFICFP